MKNWARIAMPSIPSLTNQQAALLISSEDGRRLEPSILQWSSVTKEFDLKRHIKVTPTQIQQTILGFGGAFTDAAGMNMASLPQKAQNNLLKSYFGPNSANYSIGRVPMASCDFSTRNYSYCDVPGDTNLQHFALVEEDFKYKIPFVKQAAALTGDRLKLFASPWSAPAWMKTSNSMIGAGVLKGQPGDANHQTWAQYFVKFFESYAANNVSFWGVTVQNEPTSGFVPDYKWQTMGFTPATMRDFIKLDLGPKLRDNQLGHLKLMISDDQRLAIETFADRILPDPVANSFVSGVAVHWYDDQFTPPGFLSTVHERYPDKFILATEACTGFTGLPDHRKPLLGDWGRAQEYANDIMVDMSHWVAGWTDWNLCLNLQGGPNWVQNYVDSPIIVNATSGEFYKQPMFYALAHFSAYVPPDSVYVYSHAEDPELETLAAVRPDRQRVLVLLNKGILSRDLTVETADRNETLLVKLPAKSIATVIWNK